jgi:hypothetical protein
MFYRHGAMDGIVLLTPYAIFFAYFSISVNWVFTITYILRKGFLSIGGTRAI